MDPSITKLLGEDEDETMHFGADLEAFQAALNRDIEGDMSISKSDSGQQEQVQQLPLMALKQYGSAADNQQPQSNVSQESIYFPLQQTQFQDNVEQGEAGQAPLQSPTAIWLETSERYPLSISETNKMRNPDSEHHYLDVQKMGNQQTMSMEQPSDINIHIQGYQVTVGLLLAVLKPYLDKDKEMQLQALYARLMKNCIAKEHFCRLVRNLVGEQVLRISLLQLQSLSGFNQTQLESQAFARQHNAAMPFNASAFSAAQMHADSSYPSAKNNTHESRKVGRDPDSHAMQASQIPSSWVSIVKQEREWSSISIPAYVKQQQPVETSFPMYGSKSGTYNPCSRTNVNTSGLSMKMQAHDLPMNQILHQTMGASHIGFSTQPMKTIDVPQSERQNFVTVPSRVHSGSISQYTNRSASQKSSIPWRAPTNKEQSSAPFSVNYVKQEPGEQTAEHQQKARLSNPQVLSTSSVGPGNLKDESLDKQPSKVGFCTPTGIVPSNSVSPSTATQLDPLVQVSSWIPSAASTFAGLNARKRAKKPSISHKKPLDAFGSSPPASSKKQKVSGAFLNQSIEELNDVTAVSGVNLREEEEQLFSASKEDSQVSEAFQEAVREAEERLILQKTPLHKILAEIMAKCGLKNINQDVEQCLSLCVEERICGLISSLIRLSKQRVAAEKTSDRTIVTPDVREQIMTINQKAREEWEKRLAEAEKSREVDENEDDSGVEGDKEKDDWLTAVKMQAIKEEDDKMRTTAANAAIQAAVGGDDTLAKWQLWAEQARKKRENRVEATSGPHIAKDVSSKPLPVTGSNVEDNQQPERNPASTEEVGKFGMNQGILQQIREARTISVKDIIAVLEREPQMSKSTLIFRLRETIRSDASTE